jgi:hypothetical protein
MDGRNVYSQVSAFLDDYRQPLGMLQDRGPLPRPRPQWRHHDGRRRHLLIVSNPVDRHRQNIYAVIC